MLDDITHVLVDAIVFLRKSLEPHDVPRRCSHDDIEMAGTFGKHVYIMA